MRVDELDGRMTVIDMSWKMSALLFSAALFVIWKMQGQQYSSYFDSEFWGPILGISMMIVSTYILGYCNSLTFDRSTGVVTIIHKRMISLKEEEIAISEIKNVVIQSGGVGDSSQGYRIALITTDEKEILFSPAYVAGGRDKCEEIIEQVKEFISMEQSDVVSDNVKE